MRVLPVEWLRPVSASGGRSPMDERSDLRAARLPEWAGLLLALGLDRRVGGLLSTERAVVADLQPRPPRRVTGRRVPELEGAHSVDLDEAGRRHHVRVATQLDGVTIEEWRPGLVLEHSDRGSKLGRAERSVAAGEREQAGDVAIEI